MRRKTAFRFAGSLVAALCVLFLCGGARAAGILAGEGTKDPVVLVHGYSGSVLGQLSVEGYWIFVGSRLELDGYDTYKIALGDAALQDIRASAGELKNFVAGVLAKTGKSKVDIVGHSEGGLVARYYISRLGGGAFVDDLVTIATPHRGTSTAHIGPGEAARQMEIHSDFLVDLNSGQPLAPDVDHTAIFSNHDEMVFPPDNGFFAGAVNINYNLLGHAGIMLNEDVYRSVRGAISNDLASGHRAAPISIAGDGIATNQGTITVNFYQGNHYHPGASAKDMKVSTNQFFTGASWESFKSAKTIALDTTHSGLKAVYVKYREREGFLGVGDNESPAYVDYVFYDKEAPELSFDVVPEATLGGEVEVNLDARDNSDAFKTFQAWNALFAYGLDELGVKEMMLSADPSFAGAQWRPFASRATVSLGAGAGAKTVYAKVRDGAGNAGPAVSDSVYVIDPAAGDVGMVAEGDRDPVVLVHGYGGSIVGDVSAYINWVYISEKLSSEGLDVRRIALSLAGMQDVKVSAAELRDFVAAALAETGAKKVDIICHSEGGLVARYYVKNLGGAAFVDDLVTISTPHRGTTVASIGPGEAARQMEVASDFLKELNSGDALPGDVEYTAVFSHSDEIVLPGKNGFFDGAVNVNYVEFGHAGILFHPKPYSVARNALLNRYLAPKSDPPVRIVDADMTTAANQIEVEIRAMNHYAPASPVREMMVSTNGLFMGAAWRPFVSKVVLDVSGQDNGLLGVHVKFRGADGTESPSYADYIALDREAPRGVVATAAADSVSRRVAITIQASDNTDKYTRIELPHLLEAYGLTGLGTREMMVSAAPDFAGAAWEPLADRKSVEVSAGAGLKTVYVKLRDAAGNVSPVYTASAQMFNAANGYTAIETQRNPVVFVHGHGSSIVGDVSAYLSWMYYVERLKARGYSTHVAAFDNAAMGDIKKSAEQLRDFVMGVAVETGAVKVDLVCHSEGGLIARYFVKYLGGGSLVDDLVTIATPHRGTIVAEIGPGEAARQMEVASAFLRELNGGIATPGMVDYTSIFSNNDEMVLPAQNAFFAGAVNINTNVYEHATILFNDEVFGAVEAALNMNVGRKTSELPVYINREKPVTRHVNVDLTLNYYNHNQPEMAGAEMIISGDKFLAGGQWRSLAGRMPFTLEGDDGLKAVYVRYRSASGKESPIYVDYIVLDRTPPAGAFVVEKTADTGTMNLMITARDNADAWTRLNPERPLESWGISGIGLAEMAVCGAADFGGCVWEPFGGAKEWKPAAGETRVYLKFRDAAGNESAAISAPLSGTDAPASTSQPPAPVDPPAPTDQPTAVDMPQPSGVCADTGNICGDAPVEEAPIALDADIEVEVDFGAGWNLLYVSDTLPGSVRGLIAEPAGKSGGVFDVENREFRKPSLPWLTGDDRAFWLHLDKPFAGRASFKAYEAVIGPARRVALREGWNVAGVSGYRETPVERLTIIAGADELTFEQAAAQGWVSQKFLEYRDGKYIRVDSLKPFRAYLIKAYRPCILNIP